MTADQSLTDAFIVAGQGPPYAAVADVGEYRLRVNSSSFGDAFIQVRRDGELVAAWEVGAALDQSPPGPILANMQIGWDVIEPLMIGAEWRHDSGGHDQP